MNSTNDYLELNFTDKQSGEQWECSYEASYIESITKKTGNFKQFEIFITMLKSGLLKTSSCITLDLLTYEDLESLRSSRLKNGFMHKAYGRNNNNRRYLIVTYSVEFDRINYPLPLEYCGLPDPVVLQATIKKLEAELIKATSKCPSGKSNSHDRQKIKALQKRIEELVIENLQLNENIQQLTRTTVRKPKPKVEVLQKAITQLEKNVVSERNSHHRLVEKLQNDKVFLAQQIDMLKVSEDAMKNKLLELSRLSVQQNKKRQDTTKPFNSDAFKRQKSPNLLPHPRSRSVSPTFLYDKNWRQLGRDNVRRSKSGESRSSSISSGNRQFLKKDSSRSHSPSSRKQLPRSRSISRESVKSVKRQAAHKSRMKKRSGSSLAKSASDDVEEYETQLRQLYRNHHSHRF